MRLQIVAIKAVCDCCGRVMNSTKGNVVLFEYERSNFTEQTVEEGWYRNFNTGKDYCPHCHRVEKVDEDSYEVITLDGDRFECEW